MTDRAGRPMVPCAKVAPTGTIAVMPSARRQRAVAEIDPAETFEPWPVAGVPGQARHDARRGPDGMGGAE
jgi:hypothetical protein